MLKTMIRLYSSSYSINHNNNYLMALLVNHFSANKVEDINNQYWYKSRQIKYHHHTKLKQNSLKLKEELITHYKRKVK